MHIRHWVFLLTCSAASGAFAQDTKSVVTLPGVHASATPACVEHAEGSTATLSYACLNHLVANDVAPVPMPGNADIARGPSNTLGLYNANSLSHRMGPNLGTSVQPYRPKVTYPSPLTQPAIPTH
ncbi:MAG TPA: hypothetical protein VM621_01440 [Luteibacter sp.]|uniref:hypothetical protein n=1 Tax=Luteibacter sp. TaxID=1886636 RepID=UPI002B629A46|nr:hypothetical protein [Luteibacter sp.]HVI53697.1 hypothetical protein [Luteibacter sp.]